MRIAIVIHEYPPVGGGAATAAAQTARALCAEGHEVLVVTGGGGNLPSSEQTGPVRIERLPAIRFATLAPSALELLSFCASAGIDLQRRLRAFRAEGVLAYFAVPAGPFAVGAARRLGIPVVVSLRGSDVPGFRRGRLDGRLGPLAHPLIRWTLSRADAVAPNSEVLRALALAFMPAIEPKLHLVPNGIEGEHIAPAPASSGGSDLRLIQVGQLIERKRVQLTLDALAGLLPDTAARLTVIGDGPLRAYLEARAGALGVAGKVTFRGHMPRAAILDELRHHDTYVMTSLAEGMSNALLEAMAAGLPVVTTENGSHDLVERAGCGFVIPRDDAGALAARLRELAESVELRRTMGHAALDHARTLTWQACAQDLVRLLEPPR